jgi:trehalose-6-phosphate synthase
MSLEERKARWSVMAGALRKHSINEWCSNYLTRFATMDVSSRAQAASDQDH